MWPLVLLSMLIEMGKGNNVLKKRKGTCPLCRRDVREIFYKNKVISPSYLQDFDYIMEENLVT